MNDFCASYGDRIVCTDGEMLIIVAFIELFVYAAIFWGGWSLLRNFWIKRERKVEESEWKPPKFD